LNGLGSALIAGLLSGSVIATVLGLMTQRRSIMLESQIQDSFRRLVETRESQWALLQQVLGPVCAHLQRTELAFARWKEQNLFLEQQIIAESNREVRRILLEKYHLLTPHLRVPAMQLVQHYDRWFEEFDRQRQKQSPEEGTARFVFVGPEGFPFPRQAQRMFYDALDDAYAQLVAPREGNVAS
jgi:hypothetical protein